MIYKVLYMIFMVGGLFFLVLALLALLECRVPLPVPIVRQNVIH